MKKIVLCFIFAELSISLLFSQNNSGMMSVNKRDILDSVMNLHYVHPKGYILDTTYNDWKDNFYSDGIRRIIGTLVETRLISEDGHFSTFLYINEPFTREDSIKMSVKMNGNGISDRVDKEHIYRVKEIVGEFYGEKKAARWKKYVRYYTSQDSENQFNADTVIFLSLPKMKKEYYVSPYPYCSVLIIQKNDRGYLPMFCFYDEIGEKNLEKYLSDLRGAFRYGDEQPLKKELSSHDMVTIRVMSMQKKGNK
jgi:hypothetical protein